MQRIASDSKTIRALLVDDDIAYLEVLRFFLERDGFIEGEPATSAKQALEMLSQKEFDVVISDYMMPEMDGLELLKIIRLQGKDIPFIMLTGRGREDVAIDALNSGADFYIPKGGDPKTQYPDLMNMIRRSVQQRRAERDLREGERFLKMVFESIQDGVSVLSKDLVIEMVNPTIEKWYASSMPLVGKKCYEAYRGRSEPCEMCPTMRTIRSCRMNTERITKHGVASEESGWLTVYSFPMVNEETGEVERVIEYLRDVTEEEQAKELLRKSERQYRSLVNLASEGILAIEFGGTITFANPRMAEMLGYDLEELVGEHIGHFVDKVWADSVGPARLHRVLEAGERLELVFSRKDGTPVDVIMAASPLSAGSGLFEGAMAVVTDITALKKIMDSLVSSEEKFARVFHLSPQMMMIAQTSNSEIIEVNESFSKFTGFERGQAIGKNYTELGIIPKELDEKLREIFETKGVVRDIEVGFGTAAGGIRLVNLSGYRMNLQGEQCTIFISNDQSAETTGLRELRRERDVLKAILESTPSGVVITDLDGNLVECNQTMQEQLGGLPKDKLIGMNTFTTIGGKDPTKVIRVVQKLKTEGVIKDIPFTVTREDGIVMQMSVSASVVTDPLGKPLYLVGIVRDVTDQMRYQADLVKALEERRQLVSIINQSPAVAVIWRPEPGWPVEYVSDNIRQFGYEAGELTSGVADFASAVHPDDLDRVKNEVQAYIEQGVSEFEQEYRVLSPEGKQFWILGKTMVIRDRAGNVESLQGIVVDITDRKNALERLSRTEKQLKMFMDMSPVIKFMKDRAGRYVYVNKRYQDAFGITATEWVGKTDAEVFPPEVSQKLMESDRKVLETNRFHSHLESIPQRDGVHEYLTYKFIVPSISGGEDLLAGVAVDLTEERRYERALRLANEKLNLLGSMTRHDIMNQLAVLVGWLEVLRDGETNPVAAKHFKDVRAAADTIERLLVFASEYQSIGVKEPVWVDVSQSFAEGVMGLPMRNVELSVDVPGLQIYADPMFERMFRNLVDNSLRHGGSVSRIKLNSRMDGRELVLVYEDDGVGVPDSIKERIFEKGFGKHTGLGLFMTRHVLNLTGLSIRETGSEGSGARFEIRIPQGGYRYGPGKG